MKIEFTKNITPDLMTEQESRFNVFCWYFGSRLLNQTVDFFKPDLGNRATGSDAMLRLVLLKVLEI